MADIIVFSRPAHEVWDLVMDGRSKCSCGADLRHGTIMGYPHEDGWEVPGKEEKYWLFATCPKCRYDIAIWKMGVPRDFNFQTPLNCDPYENYDQPMIVNGQTVGP